MGFLFKGITYAGNHGLDIVHEDGSTFVHPMPSDFKTKLDRLHNVLKEKVCRWVSPFQNDVKFLIGYEFV